MTPAGLLSRRALITASGAAAATSLAPLPVLAGTGDPAALLPTTPEAGLRQFIRLFSGLTGSSVFTNEGLIYGKIEGELPRPLFGFISVLEVRAREIEPGLWRSEQKEAMAVLDMRTRMPVATIANPYTGATNHALGYVSPLNVYYFDASGSGFRARPKPGQTSRLWRSTASDVWVTESRYNYFPSSIQEDEFPSAYAGPIRNSVDILTYRAQASDFANAQLSSVPVQLTMVSDTPWPLWMLMGKRPGTAIYHGSGQKYRRLRDLPAISQRAIDLAYPGFLDDPWSFDSEPWGTAAQMRRLKAQGRL